MEFTRLICRVPDVHHEFTARIAAGRKWPRSGTRLSSGTGDSSNAKPASWDRETTAGGLSHRACWYSDYRNEERKDRNLRFVALGVVIRRACLYYDLPRLRSFAYLP